MQDIANSIGELLVKSGWSFRQGRGTVHGEAFSVGIVAVVQPSSNLTAAASEMVSYLKADRIDSAVDLNVNAPNDAVVIRVGPRPRALLLNPAIQIMGKEQRAEIEKKEKEKKAETDRLSKDWGLYPRD